MSISEQPAPSFGEIKNVQEKLLTTFEAFKRKNDDRLADLEKRGAEDPIAREQVEKITLELKALGEFRDLQQKQAKQIEQLELGMARPGGKGVLNGERDSPEKLEHRNAFLNYLRDPECNAMALHAAEKRAVSTATDSAGGYAVPEIISRKIERELAERKQTRPL